MARRKIETPGEGPVPAPDLVSRNSKWPGFVIAEWRVRTGPVTSVLAAASTTLGVWPVVVQRTGRCQLGTPKRTRLSAIDHLAL